MAALTPTQRSLFNHMSNLSKATAPSRSSTTNTITKWFWLHETVCRCPGGAWCFVPVCPQRSIIFALDLACWWPSWQLLPPHVQLPLIAGWVVQLRIDANAHKHTTGLYQQTLALSGIADLSALTAREIKIDVYVLLSHVSVIVTTTIKKLLCRFLELFVPWKEI